jgi:hypothetical protein
MFKKISCQPNTQACPVLVRKMRVRRNTGRDAKGVMPLSLCLGAFDVRNNARHTFGNGLEAFPKQAG